MPKKKQELATISSEDLEEWYTAGAASKKLSETSGRPVGSSYVTKLGQLGKIRTRKIHDRLVLYSKVDVDAYRVEARGTKSGKAQRTKHGSTGPTAREARKAEKQVA